MLIRRLRCLLPVVFCTACATSVTSVSFGVQDATTGSQIERINGLSRMRTNLEYGNVVQALRGDMTRFSANPYAISRIRNELAELYTYQVLDLESAIEIDEGLVRDTIPSVDAGGGIVPKHEVANQKILTDRAYLADFVTINEQKIRDDARERLMLNRRLAMGKRPDTIKKYGLDALRQHRDAVLRDIDSTRPGTADRFKILSRLVRAEYEINKLGGDFESKAKKYISNGSLPIERIDLSEIDFLSLSDYLISCFNNSGEIVFAEWALSVIYRPYANLRNHSYRWQFNKLINEYISILIDANFRSGQYEEMLYYASLNKSRMLFEERLAFLGAKAGVVKISDFVDDGIVRDKAGLPDKKWYREQLSRTPNFLDFYIGGKYVAQAERKATRVQPLLRSAMPLTTRDFGVEDNLNQVDSFVDDSLYVSRILNGSVVSVEKLYGAELNKVRKDLDESYSQVSNPNVGILAQASFMKTLIGKGDGAGRLVVSADKWMARHPIDAHLGTQVTRTVNFFMAGEVDMISNVNIAGFFNPTGDLAGAEQEAQAIRSSVPALREFRRDQAKIAALASVGDVNILHLSMHGGFDSQDARNSKLYFSGARPEIKGKIGLIRDDVNALYARDMMQYPALKERDLIFAAACQTGLSTADQVNEGELIGILRPLTANRNRNVILSLWKVDDGATRDFVEIFYRQLDVNHNIAQSFHFAQAAVKSKYSKPYYWAAFYLSQSR